MTTKEILEECNKKYPIGSEYLPMHTNGEYFTNISIVEHKARTICNREKGESQTSIEMGVGYCYIDGKWAESVYSKVKEEINNAYIQF